MFIDEVLIHVKAGDGGSGAVSFRREKFVPKGGPDGGDGGYGGHVILSVDPNMRTLLRYRHQRTFKAGQGRSGAGSLKTGHSGEDCVIPVPAGTMVRILPGEQLFADLVKPGDSVRVARGGRGGKGNARFKSSTRRTPRIATDGTPGDEHELRLTLKLLADVGLVGLPNVGKSTLLRCVSNADPKVGNYEFTTLQPSLGIVSLGEYESFVLADLPGLVEGASMGKGLGLRFLRHIERTRLLLILIDANSESPAEDLATLLRELESFSVGLARRPRLVVYSRSDLAAGRDLPDLGFRGRSGDADWRLAPGSGNQASGSTPRISAVTGMGIPELMKMLRAELAGIEKAEADWMHREEEETRASLQSVEAAYDRESRGPSVTANGRTIEDKSLDPAATGELTFFDGPAFADLVERNQLPRDFPWPRHLIREFDDRNGAKLAGSSTDDCGATDESREGRSDTSAGDPIE